MKDKVLGSPLRHLVNSVQVLVPTLFRQELFDEHQEAGSAVSQSEDPQRTDPALLPVAGTLKMARQARFFNKLY